MIKKFFAKLMSWNSNQNKEWKRDTAQEFMAESQQERNLAREREEMQKRNMRAEGIIPRIETDRPTESKERHDQAA